ncbi:galactoside alpha-(1,2)-fucosyltransferase 1-like isoform X2 [Argopecten irradians]|uniref:galactoside alpha-(1,2)-fucosyltransferase 1-like isoform X2 n=1 Tax=Argopecten irradians TaxID=31199 RepID=UPI003712E7E0
MRLRICRHCFRVRGVYQMMGYCLLFLFMILTLQFRDTVSDCTVFNLQGTLFYRPRPHFFCLKYNGNLGDQMFQYAFLLTLQIRYSTEITLPSNNILTPVFNIVPQNEFILQYCDCFSKRTQKETSYGFDPTLLNMDVNFEGSFQSYKYFESQFDEVRARFHPRKGITSKVRKNLDQIRHEHGGKNSTLVGIYLPVPEEKGIIGTDVENFMEKAIQMYKEQYRNVICVCVIQLGAEAFWMKTKFINQLDISVLVESGEDITLGLLASMDHSIILRDSLAWWGAWLAGGKVVYYKDNIDSNNRDNLDGNDNRHLNSIRFPPTWISLS